MYHEWAMKVKWLYDVGLLENLRKERAYDYLAEWRFWF